MINKNYAIITLLLFFSNILQSSQPQINPVTNNAAIAQFLTIDYKLNHDTEKLTLEDVQDMKNELNKAAPLFLQQISTNTKIDKNVQSKIIELRQNQIRKMQNDLELLLQALQTPDEQIVQFRNFLTQIKQSAFIMRKDIDQISCPTFNNLYSKIEKNVNEIDEIKKNVMISSLISPFQKKFLDNRLQFTKVNYIQILVFVFSTQCFAPLAGQMMQTIKQKVSSNVTIDRTTIDAFKKKITELEETISHPFFKKLYKTAQENAGGMIGFLDMSKLLELMVTGLLKFNEDKNMNLENKKMIAEIIDSLIKLQSLIKSV